MKPLKVLIVGGGSAGWISAAYMDAYLNGVNGGPKDVEITVVESKTIPRIGVGESTIPTMVRTLTTIKIPERDFMRTADATFKQSITFADWRETGHFYVHPFTRQTTSLRTPRGIKWLRTDRSIPFASTVSLQVYATEKALAPKLLKHPDYLGPLVYAYHIDALKFADFLSDLATSRGVKRVIDDVVDVEVDGDQITALTTKGGERFEADLYIDCTGFSRRLIGQVLGAEFESFGDFLLCDRAVATRVPYDVHRPSRIEATTLCTAKSAGWIWDIPVQSARGLGYVYSSQFLSDEEAEAELIAHEGAHVADLPKNRIKFQSGHLKTPWKGNCVAIGLAGGFIEPLESTGLWFVEDGIDLLCELLPRLGDMTHCRDLYNLTAGRRYEETSDFINLHYCLTQRDDTPFWREVRKPERISAGLAEKLATWNTKPPSPADIEYSRTLYGYHNYEYILFGMGWTPEAMAEPAPGAPAPDVADLRRQEREAEQHFMPHGDFLKEFLTGEPGRMTGLGGKETTMPTLDPETALRHFTNNV